MISAKIKKIIIWLLLFVNFFFMALGWILFFAAQGSEPQAPPQQKLLLKKPQEQKIPQITPKVLSSHLIVTELSSGEVLFEKDADKKTRPASLTKIMTALLVAEEVDNLNQKVTVPTRIYKQLKGTDIAVAGFKGGERVRKRDLLYGILFKSGAECCLTMAEVVAGSEEAFVKRMNQKAKELGMNRTHFGNSIGLDWPECYTSVRDLSKLLSYALQNETFRKVFTDKTYTIKPTNKTKGARTLENQTLAMFGADKAGTLGGKPGYTPKAALCLATVANIKGKEYICISTHATATKTHTSPQVQDAKTVYKAIRKSQ